MAAFPKATRSARKSLLPISSFHIPILLPTVFLCTFALDTRHIGLSRIQGSVEISEPLRNQSWWQSVTYGIWENT